jgi:hypothetical protein
MRHAPASFACIKNTMQHGCAAFGATVLQHAQYHGVKTKLAKGEVNDEPARRKACLAERRREYSKTTQAL